MEKETLTQMIDKINTKHEAEFKKVEEPIAITVHLSDGNSAYYRIDTDGITEHDREPDASSRISASYSDLMKAKKSKIQLVRFLGTGRIKLRGNVKMLMREIKALLS